MSEQDASEGPTDVESGESKEAGASTAADVDATVDGQNGAADEDASTENGQDATADATSVEAQAAEAGEELVERVDSADPETIAREIAALRVENEGLEAEIAAREDEIEEVESKLTRSRADFQNYKKRTEARREEARKRATADLLDRLLEVRDNLERALDQDEDVDIRGGVESTLQLFDDVLAAEDVTAIDPESGAEVDPHRHEVLVQVASEQPEGTIDDVHRVGYEMDDVVVREARVTVSDGSGADSE